MAVDTINGQTQAWNTPGELWNGEGTITEKKRYLRPIQESTRGPGVPGPARPRILRNFDPEQEPERISTVEAQPPPSVTFAGSFSALRAMRVAHQYRVSFWGPNGPMRLISQTNSPDPTSDAITQMYADFQLFNYLPDSLTPSQQEFDDFAKPQKRQALMQSSLDSIGVRSASVSAGADAIDDRLSALDSTILPTPVPFQSAVTTFCTLRVERALRGAAANG